MSGWYDNSFFTLLWFCLMDLYRTRCLAEWTSTGMFAFGSWHARFRLIGAGLGSCPNEFWQNRVERTRFTAGTHFRNGQCCHLPHEGADVLGKFLCCANRNAFQHALFSCKNILMAAEQPAKQNVWLPWGLTFCNQQILPYVTLLFQAWNNDFQTLVTRSSLQWLPLSFENINSNFSEQAIPCNGNL